MYLGLVHRHPRDGPLHDADRRDRVADVVFDAEGAVALARSAGAASRTARTGRAGTRAVGRRGRERACTAAGGIARSGGNTGLIAKLEAGLTSASASTA